MAKIIGNPTVTPMAVPDWNQTDSSKADYIKNKPYILTEEDVVELIDENGGGSEGHTHNNKNVLDKITEDKVKEWDNKVDKIYLEKYVKEYIENRLSGSNEEIISSIVDEIILLTSSDNSMYTLKVENGALTLTSQGVTKYTASIIEGVLTII